MNRSDINQVATEMRAELPRTGYAERMLRNRTFLQLLRRQDSIQLLIGHAEHQPVIEDAQTIAAAFGVAPESEPRAVTARYYGPQGHAVEIKAVAYSWRETTATPGAA